MNRTHDPAKEALIRSFHDTRSFQSDPVKGFKLASGLTSPFYIDCRTLMAEPSARHQVARVAWPLIRTLEIHCLGGLEIGAIAIATSISDYAFHVEPHKQWRTFVVRKQAKDHGLGKLIEGVIKPGDQALIVDDVLTSGGSLVKAITAARQAQLEVQWALVIVDRNEQGGRARVEQEKVKVLSLLTIDDLAQALPPGAM
jgi:orotate phosphoribosyltransferase